MDIPSLNRNKIIHPTQSTARWRCSAINYPLFISPPVPCLNSAFMRPIYDCFVSIYQPHLSFLLTCIGPNFRRNFSTVTLMVFIEVRALFSVALCKFLVDTSFSVIKKAYFFHPIWALHILTSCIQNLRRQ